MKLWQITNDPRVANPDIGPSRVKLRKWDLGMSEIFQHETRLENKNPPKSRTLCQFENENGQK